MRVEAGAELVDASAGGPTDSVEEGEAVARLGCAAGPDRRMGGLALVVA